MSETPRESPYTGPDPQSVRRMFGAIADRYDFLNHLLSLSVDRLWRRRAVRALRKLGARSGDSCIDLCTGTGDLAMALTRRLGLRTVGSDFCHPMLVRFREKLQGAGMANPPELAEADAMELPFADGSFRFATVAFGIRNVESLDRALAEIRRVLAPGGALLVLEFAKPVVPGFRETYELYFTRVLPRIGSWISGTEGPYQYLPASVGSFPAQREFVGLLERSGYVETGYRNLTGGVAALYWGRKTASEPVQD